MTNIETLEYRMNSEYHWAAKVNYFRIKISKREINNNIVSLNEEINLHLKKDVCLNPDERIDWEKEQEIDELVFKEFGYCKLCYSLAYTTKLMSVEKAKNYLDEFIENFGSKRRFFTNYDDLDDIIRNFGTIFNYESKGGGYSYGSTGISDCTFDCGLIIVDDSQIGSIVMLAED